MPSAMPSTMPSAMPSAMPSTMPSAMPSAMTGYSKLLLKCNCDNFRNGLTTDHVGDMACARSNVHGLQGIKLFCSLPPRPFLPMVDTGCPSDAYRCVVEYTSRTFPICSCSTYVNGAWAASGGLCQKSGSENSCSPMVAHDEKIGGSEYYGCPEDTCGRPHTHRSSTVARHAYTHL